MVFFYLFRYLVFVGGTQQKIRTVVQNCRPNLLKYGNEQPEQSV